MKKLILSCTAAAVLAAAGAAQAAPGQALRGETGLARTPLAAALPPLTLAVAADYVAADDTFVPMRAEFGVVEGLEVGGTYWYLDTPGDADIYGLNAKYVFPQFVENLDLAVGGHWRKQTVNEAKNDGHDLYAAVAYPVGFLVPTFGIIYESITGDNDESDVRFFGSLVANVLPTFALGAEFESASDKLDGTDADPAMWFGARFQPLEGLTVQAGMLNYANLGAAPEDLKDFVFHLGVQYAFGFGK